MPYSRLVHVGVGDEWGRCGRGLCGCGEGVGVGAGVGVDVGVGWAALPQQRALRTEQRSTGPPGRARQHLPGCPPRPLWAPRPAAAVPYCDCGGAAPPWPPGRYAHPLPSINIAVAGTISVVIGTASIAKVSEPESCPKQMTKLNACSAHSWQHIPADARRRSAHRVMIHFVVSSLSSAGYIPARESRRFSL